MLLAQQEGGGNCKKDQTMLSVGEQIVIRHCKAVCRVTD